MNLLQYDAIALGNHELDMGSVKLEKFVDLVNFPVLATNVKGLSNPDGKTIDLDSYARISLGKNETICVIGVTANEPNPLAGTSLKIAPEIDAVQKMLRELKGKHCSRKIVLSHAGIDIDRQLARESDVDAILGGHSHVIVPQVNVMPESSEFGVVVKEENNGNPKLRNVLHTGANGRYVGLLRLEWNIQSKKLIAVETEILPLDEKHGVESDPFFLKWQTKWFEKHKTKQKPRLDVAIKFNAQTLLNVKVNGVMSKVTSNIICSRPCRMGECLLGDIVTDAMRYCLEQGPCINNHDRAINRIPIIGLLEAGTLRNCLHLTDQNFNEVLPWPNMLVLLKVKGSLIRKMLQHGILSKTGGGYLQVSGLNYSHGEKHLQNDVWIEPQANNSMQLDDNAVYWLVVTDWLAAGGDGFGLLVEQATAVIHTHVSLHDALSAYASSTRNVYTIPSQYHQPDYDKDSTSSGFLNETARGAICGFVGGAIAFLLTYPVYTMFVRESVNKSIPCNWKLFEGVWIGLVASAISDGVYFMVFGSDFFHLTPFAKSSLAAVSNSLVTSPLWMIVTRKQLLSSKISIWKVAYDIYQSRGVLGFFDILPFNLIMCIHPVLRQMCFELLINKSQLSGSLCVAIAGSISSLVATIMTYPIQKLRIMWQAGSGEMSMKYSHVPVICNADCCAFFYSGFGFKLLHTGLKNFVLFFVMEQVNIMSRW